MTRELTVTLAEEECSINNLCCSRPQAAHSWEQTSLYEVHASQNQNKNNKPKRKPTPNQSMLQRAFSLEEEMDTGKEADGNDDTQLLGMIKQWSQHNCLNVVFFVDITEKASFEMEFGY